MSKHQKATENTVNDLVGEIVCGFLLAVIIINAFLFDLWHEWTGVKENPFYGSLCIIAFPIMCGFVMFREKVKDKLI